MTFEVILNPQILIQEFCDPCDKTAKKADGI